MIHSLYNMTRKGWLKALSFILASAMFVMILLKSSLFAHYFGEVSPLLVIVVFYAMVILWIHGSGFEIKATLWRVIFLPIVGYFILIPCLSYLIWL
ncbi:cyd operon protein YbgE [Bibersteinia trehalosi]|uniref:cyd operon protein YbgE n=1 Tax=Bibersteinia trehalosi TaxID=47735 RepID=UPI003D2A703E